MENKLNVIHVASSWLERLFINFRYEVFMDEVKPEDLSLAFLREFMNLPNDYFDSGSPMKYR